MSFGHFQWLVAYIHGDASLRPNLTYTKRTKQDTEYKQEYDFLTPNYTPS